MRIPRTVAVFLCLLTVPSAAAAQSTAGRSLVGDWVRVTSNNNPNDQMRITVAGSSATLTVVPSSASGSWQPGLTIWRTIQPNGGLEIRGSDGSYYPATATFVGPDVVRITIQNGGVGNAQTWRRAGPSINGPWIRLAPGQPEDGLQVQVQGAQATVRYLPATAPRGLRVGSRLWQSIAAGGALQVLGGGTYHTATVTLLGTDSLRVDSNSAGVGSGQIWVRPTALASARPGLAQPVPPICLATSIPHDQTGLTWQLGLSSPTPGDSIREVLGIRDYKAGPLQPSGSNFPLDFERSRIPGMADGFAFVWQPASRSGVAWRRYSGITPLMYTNASQAAQNAGFLPHDFEAYQTSTGVEYSGIWVQNASNVGFWADQDLTAPQYDQEYQRLSAAGYRPVDFEAYPTPGGIRYAAIWYQSCSRSNWRHTRDLDRPQYQTQVTQLGALGFQVVDFESYMTPNGQRYAAIWEQVPQGRGWALTRDRSLDWFLNDHRQHVDEGMRLLDYESYDTPNGVRYGGVWVENDRRYDMPFKTALNDSINFYRTSRAIQGISVVVMMRNRRGGGGEVIYRRGFGWADRAVPKRAHSGTIYRTASVAKVIGATLAARLEARANLGLDLTQPTSDYLPNLGSQHTHTVEQLLAKTGCVRHYDGQFADPNEKRDAQGNIVSDPTHYIWRDSAIARIESPLLVNCAPGSDYLYSTHGLTYVGAVLEEVLGKDIDQIIRDELTVPFQLPSLRVAAKGGPLFGVPYFHEAQGYGMGPTLPGPQPVDYEDSTWKVLGGGLQVDAIDLARFGWLTLTGSIADTTRLWTSLTSTAQNWSTITNARDVGLSWELNTPTVAGSVRNVAQHSGTATGARSHLSIYRDDDLVVVILTNQRGDRLGGVHPIDVLGRTVARIVLRNPPPP